MSKPSATARASKSARRAIAPAPLVVELFAPGMTPLLRAGLGGLAAALRFVHLERDPSAAWPSPIAIGGGCALVDPRRITLEWNGAAPADVLQELFRAAFRISPAGLVTLAGTFEPTSPTPRPLAIVLQEGLKRTFLQHGKATGKAGERKTATEEVDDHRFTFEWQPYASFAHQSAWKVVDKAVCGGGTVELAGWSYPGAAQKHVRYGETRSEYGPGEALSACFALIGCLSFDVRPGRMGALIIPEPSDLVEFAITRPRLTPARPADAFVASLGDAVLCTQLTLKMDDIARRHRSIGATHGILLESLPWAKQQKSRSKTLDVESVPDATLDAFYKIARTLPSRLLTKPTNEDADSEGSYFVATSALRAFVTDNLAAGRPWFAGFAQATTGGRYIHYFRDRDNLGALYPEERKGLIIMNENLDGAEKALVASVHTAIRQRFGRIFKDTETLSEQTRKNRFTDERESWRRAFAGARTHDQIRAALARLWSLAGPNQQLRESWQDIVPLLRPKHWQVARDLALVALASYQSASPIGDANPEELSAE